MVFEWLRGNQYKRFRRRLLSLERFAKQVAADVTTRDITKALSDFYAWEALIKDLTASYDKNKTEFLKHNKAAASRIKTEIIEIQVKIAAATKELEEIKEAVRGGIKPFALFGSFGQVAAIVQSIRQKLATIDDMAVLLGMAPRKPEASGGNQTLPEDSYLRRRYKANSWRETSVFRKQTEGFGKSIKQTIESVRDRALRAGDYLENLHGEIKYCKGALHAGVGAGGGLRIVYWIKTGEVVFDQVITHNEFDRWTRTCWKSNEV